MSARCRLFLEIFIAMAGLSVFFVFLQSEWVSTRWNERELRRETSHSANTSSLSVFPEHEEHTRTPLPQSTFLDREPGRARTTLGGRLSAENNTRNIEKRDIASELAMDRNSSISFPTFPVSAYVGSSTNRTKRTDGGRNGRTIGGKKGGREGAKTHFIHIGKTGGTAIKKLLARTKISFHSHGFLLGKGDPGDTYVFFVRDPVERWVSGYLSRLRQGCPAHFHLGTKEELNIFDPIPLSKYSR